MLTSSVEIIDVQPSGTLFVEEDQLIIQDFVRVSLVKQKLEQALRIYAIPLIRRLSVVGNVTDEDFQFICNNMTCSLEILDLSDAYIASGVVTLFAKRTPLLVYNFALDMVVRSLERIVPVSLKEIYFPKNQQLIRVDENAFGHATKLQKIHNLNVVEIRPKAFASCPITRATISAMFLPGNAFPKKANIRNTYSDVNAKKN